MKTKNIFLVLIAISIILTPAPTFAQENQTDLYTLLNSSIETYNANTGKIPASLKSIIGSEEIILKISQSDNTTLYISAKTADAYVTSFEKINDTTGKDDNLAIIMDETSMRSLIASPSATALRDDLKSGAIRVESAGFLKRILLWLIKSGLAKIFM